MNACDRPFNLQIKLSADEHKLLEDAYELSAILNFGHKHTRSFIAREAIIKACKDIRIRAKRAKGDDE